MPRQVINHPAIPPAIGAYSQMVRAGNLIFISGQISDQPGEAGMREVLTKLNTLCQAAGYSLDNLVKLTVYLLDLEQFPLLNQLFEEFFTKPYPARAAIEVQRLPKNAQIEIEAILSLHD